MNTKWQDQSWNMEYWVWGENINDFFKRIIDKAVKSWKPISAVYNDEEFLVYPNEELNVSELVSQYRAKKWIQKSRDTDKSLEPFHAYKILPDENINSRVRSIL